MLFADRLEVWNPGRLPPPLTLEKLRVPHESIPGNPLLARAMYLVKYIEQMGTGTLDMIDRCAKAGLPEPEFEASGEFVTRIRRAALAGQPVVFTGQTGFLADTGEKAREKADTSGEDTARTREKARESTREKTGEKILALIAADAEITTARMAEEIGISRKGIEWQIRRLKSAGRLERIGPAKGGRWRVVGEDDG